MYIGEEIYAKMSSILDMHLAEKGMSGAPVI